MSTPHRIRAALAILITGLSLCMPYGTARAQPGGDFGLGIILGDPTGLSGKTFLSSTNAIDFAVGLGFIDGDHLHLHADYLWHFDIEAWSAAALDLHAGVGPKLGIGFGDDDRPGRRDRDRDDWVGVGVRGPCGLTLRFLNAPFDIFLEVALGLWLVPDPDFDLDAAIGGRYWF